MSHGQLVTLGHDLLLLDVAVVIAFVAIVGLAIRAWGRRGLWMAFSAIPLVAIWLVVRVIVSFSGPWCDGDC
jgi:hypothetical protein